ncbi:FAD-dependent dehydrogenase [Fulvitalea axinellae]|uniref:FAD-dependent dehydrogenase n=1 Tax=Fulvitalea axinellae TaxID=1182444 RepID=A0AAU9CFZ5_9BACT|nr:FAD-dependent dehydrogenase [Fulvitalea axinellae]
MKKSLKYTVSPKVGFDPENLKGYVRRKLGLVEGDRLEVVLTNRSVDARKAKVKINVALDVFVNEEPEVIGYKKSYPDVRNAKRVVIVGAGPAGLFAALRLIEKGMKPVIVERGKDVQARRRDLAAINKDHVVDPDSNYCFGEGGAGTYSDGKLYTRAKKRGDFRRILEIFVAHGANPEILADAHPHIGTNKLPKIIADMRESIIGAGGEVIFEARVSDIILKDGEAKGVITKAGDKIEGEAVLLATGHSARDIYELLHEKGVKIETKPFALGVRIEHAQNLIDRIQYHCSDRGVLPAASYSLVSQVSYKGDKKGVFSFCMCPGGFIVPAATAPGEVVVNGMSPSRRDSKYANSGIVVAIDESDWAKYGDKGVLAALEFQKRVERRAFKAGGETQVAPAQRMMDFVEGKESSSLLETSYQPGLNAVDMRSVLPKQVSYRLKTAFRHFGQKMKGYLTNEAQIVGVESRTSSPVRVPRNPESFEHVEVSRLFPCGEGTGYAGGIASAAIDGERCAEKIAEIYG